MKKLCIVGVMACVLVLVGYTNATMMPSDGKIQAMWGENGNGHQWTNMNGAVDNEDGSFTITDTMMAPGNCQFDVTLTFDPDPFVDAAFSVTNNSGVNQTFTFIYSTLVNPQLSEPTLYGGSMSGSATADTTAGFVSTDAVSQVPLYQGKIDGTTVLPFYPDPTVWNMTPGESIDILAKNSPLTNVGPAVTSEISMVYTFTLTPGETATMNGIFAVIVPEPATLAILGLGAVLVRSRKR